MEASEFTGAESAEPAEGYGTGDGHAGEPEPPEWFEQGAQDFNRRMARMEGNGYQGDEIGSVADLPEGDDEPWDDEDFDLEDGAGRFAGWPGDDGGEDGSSAEWDGDDASTHPLSAFAADLDSEIDEDYALARELLLPDDGQGADPGVNSLRQALADEFDAEKEAFYAERAHENDELLDAANDMALADLERRYPELADGPYTAAPEVMAMADQVGERYGLDGGRANAEAVELAAQLWRLGKLEEAEEQRQAQAREDARAANSASVEGDGGSPGPGEPDHPFQQIHAKSGGGRNLNTVIRWPG